MCAASPHFAQGCGISMMTSPSPALLDIARQFSHGAIGSGRSAARSGLFAHEPLAAAHMRVDALLGHGHELARVVAVVMHPLVDEVVHGEAPHLRVRAPARKVLRSE